MRQLWFINAVLLTVSAGSWASDSIADNLKRLSDRAFGSVMTEKIAEVKKLAEPPDKVGRNVKDKLDLYSDANPMRIVANDICSAKGAKFNAYYKNEVFSFSEILDPTEKNIHKTQIRYKQLSATENEKYVQIESYRVSEYGTYTYALTDGNQVTDLKDVKTSIRMIDQFVSSKVLPALPEKSSIAKKEHATLKLELDKAWNLLKEAGACCAVSACKTVLASKTAPSAGSQHQSLPAGRSGAQ